MFKKSALLLTLSIAMVGCSSVTIQPKKMPKIPFEPTYQESRSFYFWGLVGEQRVDVKAVCQGREVQQMQSQQTFADGLLGVLTLGIYAPHTVKVWCK